MTESPTSSALPPIICRLAHQLAAYVYSEYYLHAKPAFLSVLAQVVADNPLDPYPEEPPSSSFRSTHLCPETPLPLPFRPCWTIDRT